MTQEDGGDGDESRPVTSPADGGTGDADGDEDADE